MIANSTKPTDIVYDPFCGSGTTLVAAHQLGRIGYGVELDLVTSSSNVSPLSDSHRD